MADVAPSAVGEQLLEPGRTDPRYEMTQYGGPEMKGICAVLLGGAAIALATSAQAQDQNDKALQAREHRLTERLNRQQLEYRAMPRPSPRTRWRWYAGYGYWPQRYADRYAGYRYAGYEAPLRVSRSPTQKSSQTAIHEKKLASIDSHPNRAAADIGKPLTPAEIRSAVPLDKLKNPKEALSNAGIRTLWGDSIGHVRAVDTNGTAVKSIEAGVGGKSVRLDATRLKYVKSRNLLITAMSKADVEKLPKSDRS